MPGLRIIMVQSADGFMSRGPNDDMSWSGPQDKALFRALTLSSGAWCLASSRTRDSMPRSLPGRRLSTVVRSPESSVTSDYTTLDEAAESLHGAWLLGGMTLALAAIDRRLVTEAHVMVTPVSLRRGQRERLSSALVDGGLRLEWEHPVGNISHRVWRRRP